MHCTHNFNLLSNVPHLKNKTLYISKMLLKALIQLAYLARVTSLLAVVVAIFLGHENGDNKGQPRDGARKACLLNNSL